jgi:hypothetical protein
MEEFIFLTCKSFNYCTWDLKAVSVIQLILIRKYKCHSNQLFSIKWLCFSLHYQLIVILHYQVSSNVYDNFINQTMPAVPKPLFFSETPLPGHCEML